MNKFKASAIEILKREKKPLHFHIQKSLDELFLGQLEFDKIIRKVVRQLRWHEKLRWKSFLLCRVKHGNQNSQSGFSSKKFGFYPKDTARRDY